MTPKELAKLVLGKAEGHKGRFIVAIAGPPACGKSTLAADLAREIGPGARVLAMDGFHFDDAVLTARGHQSRKGAPHTFDVAGLAHCLGRIRAGEVVAIPVFDRALELSRAGAVVVEAEDQIILVEGNYLLLTTGDWPRLLPMFDLTVMVDVPEPVLRERLTARWQHYKLTPEEIAWKLDGNDLPNGRRIIAESRSPDLRIVNG